MGTRVLVTGANGHVGQFLCRALVGQGYDVRATVRDADDPAKADGPRRAGVVDVVSLDIRDGDRFAAVAKGGGVLFHVAATYRYWTGGAEADHEMIRDAVEGAANAVRAAASAGVRRLVLTSSIVTLPFMRAQDRKADEGMWRTDLRVPYFRAKTLAEQEAWRLADELGVEMVTVLPGAIIGPFERRTTSIEIVENVMRGSLRTGVPRTSFPAVDVRDVAIGHILAAEKDCAGRFILCNDDQPTFAQLVDEMRRIDPSVPKSWMVLPDAALAAAPVFDWLNRKLLGTNRTVTPELIASMRGQWWNYSNARARAVLGWHPSIPLARSLADTMTRLRELMYAAA